MDELKIKELEEELTDLKNMLPTYKDKKSCGRIIHNDSVELLLKIEELEEEIQKLKKAY